MFTLGICMNILQAEILVTEGCLDIMLKRNYQKRDIAIHCDNQVAIEALNFYVSKFISDSQGGRTIRSL